MYQRFRRLLSYLRYGIQPQIIKANIVVSSASGRLANKNIIITGGGRGLGYYIAKKAIEEGANVIITGRNQETLIKATKRLNDKCKFVVFDVTQISQIASFFDKCEELFNANIDCLVNNAGISLHEGNIQNVTIDSWNKQFMTNLQGPYFLSQEFSKRFVENQQSNGSIIFISSERGLYCDDIPYGLIKSSINSLTAGLGRRYISNGLRVNAIAPGVTASDMTGFSKEGDLSRPIACGGRVYLPEEVAEVVAFLLSDAAGAISSQIIPCNRGNHLRCDW